MYTPLIFVPGVNVPINPPVRGEGPDQTPLVEGKGFDPKAENKSNDVESHELMVESWPVVCSANTSISSILQYSEAAQLATAIRLSKESPIIHPEVKVSWACAILPSKIYELPADGLVHATDDGCKVQGPPSTRHSKRTQSKQVNSHPGVQPSISPDSLKVARRTTP